MSPIQRRLEDRKAATGPGLPLSQLHYAPRTATRVNALQREHRRATNAYVFLPGAVTFGEAMNSHRQGMLYELGREIISSRIGRLSSEIGQLETSRGNDHRIRQLELQIVDLAREREVLRPEDEGSVRTLIVRYCEKPIADLLDNFSAEG